MIERVEVDERDLAMLVAALRAESDGKALNRDLVHGLRAVVEPAAAAARSAILSMGTSGLHHPEPALRTVVAEQTKVTVRTAGKHPSVGVRVTKHGMPRGFDNAPKRLNAAKGWRHPVFGQDTWVSQRGRPGWFDDTLNRFKPAAERAAHEAMDGVAERISVRTRG